MTEATTPRPAVGPNGRGDATPGDVGRPGMRISCTACPTGWVGVIATR
jgi:hypothetical protein